MEELTTTAPRKPNKYSALRVVWFGILLVSAISIQSLVAWSNYSFSDYGNAVIIVSYELNWLHNFSDVPGVKGYAQELLKADMPDLPFGLIAVVFFYWVPFLLLGIGVNTIVKRRITRLQFAIVSYSFLFIVLSIIVLPQ